MTAGAVVVFQRRHDPRTPLLAAGFGFTAAIMVAQAHVAPHWSFLSDSYIDDIHPDALSWAVVLFEIAAASFLGVVGLHQLRVRDHGAAEPSVR